MSSIIIVLPKIEDAKKIKKILMQHGFDNIISCTTGASALMEMNKQSGGLVISGYKLPDMYYTELADMIPSFYEILFNWFSKCGKFRTVRNHGSHNADSGS